MSKFETIRKLRALQSSPYPEEAEAAKRKADALESDLKYEEWIIELSEMLHRNLDSKYADELLDMLIEKYYHDGYVGNYGYQEYMKEGACRYFAERYYSKYNPISQDDVFNVELTDDEKMCMRAVGETITIVSDFLDKNGISKL